MRQVAQLDVRRDQGNNGARVGQPVWSPDGTMLAYLDGSGNGGPTVIDVASGTQGTLHLPDVWYFWELAWIPNG
jgi:hypothetical protein